MKRKNVIELRDNGKTEHIICENKKQAKKLTRLIIKNNLLKLKAVS